MMIMMMIYQNNAKSQIDYIIKNKKRINNTLKCEAYSSVEGVSKNGPLLAGGKL